MLLTHNFGVHFSNFSMIFLQLVESATLYPLHCWSILYLIMILMLCSHGFLRLAISECSHEKLNRDFGFIGRSQSWSAFFFPFILAPVSQDYPLQFPKGMLSSYLSGWGLSTLLHWTLPPQGVPQNALFIWLVSLISGAIQNNEKNLDFSI